MHQCVVQIYILALTIATVFCKTPKIERKQGTADYRYDYLPVAHLDGNMGLHGAFVYGTEEFSSNADSAPLGIMLGSKTLANIGTNNINSIGAINKHAPVLVQQTVPFPMKRPIAIPVSVRIPVTRAVPVSVIHARPANTIQNQRPVHYSLRKEVPRFFSPKTIHHHTTSNSKFASTHISKHRHPTNGKGLSHPVVAVASPTVSQESTTPQYMILSELNDASGLKYGSAQAYPESFNVAVMYDNTPQGYTIPHTNQDHSTVQYVPTSAKHSKQSAPNNREYLGLSHFSSAKDSASHLQPSVMYDPHNGKTVESNGTPGTYVYYSGTHIPFNYDQESLSAHTNYGNTANSAQNIKSQTYHSKYSTKYNIQEDANDSNFITHSNFENYAQVPTPSVTSDESYDGGRTSLDSNSDQINYAYYTSAKSHGPDTIEPQSSNNHLIGVSYGPSAK